MAKGQRPAYSLKANTKDTPKGEKREYLEVGAAWYNQFGGLNFSLAKGAKVRLADGTVLDGDHYFFSLFENKKKDEDDEWSTKPKQKSMEDDDWGAKPQTPSDREGDPAPSDDPMDDIPF